MYPIVIIRGSVSCKKSGVTFQGTRPTRISRRSVKSYAPFGPIGPKTSMGETGLSLLLCSTIRFVDPATVAAKYRGCTMIKWFKSVYSSSSEESISDLTVLFPDRAFG